MALGSGFHMVFEAERVRVLGGCTEVVWTEKVVISTYDEEYVKLEIAGSQYLVRWADLAATVRAVGEY